MLNIIRRLFYKENVPTSSFQKQIKEDYKEEIADKKEVEVKNQCSFSSSAKTVELMPVQKFVQSYLNGNRSQKGMLLWHSVGCHGKDTMIKMFNGKHKMVQDIQVGDLLMGDDSTPRKVLELKRGKGQMYKVIPNKGDEFIINDEHIMCLYPTKQGCHYVSNRKKYAGKYIDTKTYKIVSKYFSTKEEGIKWVDNMFKKHQVMEIKLSDYLKLTKSLKRELKLYKNKVDYESKKISFDPYIIGLWLGDGSKRDPVITNQDAEIIKYLKENLGNYNLYLQYQSGYDYRINSIKKTNIMNDFLKKYNMIDNKHIPDILKYNTREVRLQVLAGLIDSDGSYVKGVFEITQKREHLIDDIIELTKSLGFMATKKLKNTRHKYNGEIKISTAYRCVISGEGIEEIPTLIKRKKAISRQQKKNVNVFSFNIEELNIDDFYGFTLDKNQRYLDSNFIVHHNSGKTCTSVATVSLMEEDFTSVLWVTRSSLKQDMWKNVVEKSCHEVVKKYDLPNDKEKRKRVFNQLTKKRWIPPMSYRSFNNLKNKSNKIRKELEKRNGKTDFLKNTFIIIDEAHNMFNPEDMSFQERVDFEEIKEMIYNSYEKSGENSCRLLLLTATPINDSPLQMCKLLNLLISETEKRLPETEEDFINKFINKNDYSINSTGKSFIINSTKNLISYVDRSRDKNYFTQKIFKPSIKTKFDSKNAKFIQEFLDGTRNISEIQDRLCSQQELFDEINELSSMNVDSIIKIKLIQDKFKDMPKDFFYIIFEDINVLKSKSDYNLHLKEKKDALLKKYQSLYDEQIKQLYKIYGQAEVQDKKKIFEERNKLLKVFKEKYTKELSIFMKQMNADWKYIHGLLDTYVFNCKKIVKDELESKKKKYTEYMKKFYKVNVQTVKNINSCIINAKNKGKNVNICKKNMIWSDALKNKIKFESNSYDPQFIKSNLQKYSPLVYELIKNIASLDKEDMKTQGKLFKHVIYTDKKGYNGLKLAISLLQAYGFNLMFEPFSSKRGKSLRVKKSKGGSLNMLCLSSSAIYDVPFSKKMKDDILKSFNERPDNINGQNYRFMLFDGGYKEGVDLFDVKYFHILQTPDYENQITQVLGRATRFCGQSGLEFEKNKGWFLDIYLYDMELNFELDISKVSNTKDLNEHFLEETYNTLSENKKIMKKMEMKLSDVIQDNAVDKLLFQ